ncbi:MAG: zinc ABC transporter substrate-binding protein [Armatimonadetes bacterium]|nr:zinc ABC transporter substrate-binding protein [Armatimonadota bacterium]
MIIARNIAAGLKRVDPSNASTYDARYLDYARRLKAAVEKWVKEMAPLRGMKVVTYHKSWPYFARRFGLVVVENVEPRPGIPPSAAHTSRVIQEIKAQKVKVLVMEPYFSRDVPDAIARETGVKVVVMSPSTGGLPGVDSYIAMFDKNIQLLLQAAR